MKVNEKDPSSSYGLPATCSLSYLLRQLCRPWRWAMSNSAGFTLNYYLMDKHFYHIANQSKKNSQWMFQPNRTATTCKSLPWSSRTGKVRRWFHLAPSSVRIIITTVLCQNYYHDGPFAYVKSCLWKCHFERSSSSLLSAFWLHTCIKSRLWRRIEYS